MCAYLCRRPGAIAAAVNGKSRDECLNVHWFLTLAQARQIIMERKEDDNTQRPHRALQQLPPAVFAQSIPA